MNEYQEKLERVAKAAKVIFDVTTVAGIRTKQIHCPHGNIPSYPTHAWWCDKCFWELKEALQDVEAFQQSFAPDGATFAECGAMKGKRPLGGSPAKSCLHKVRPTKHANDGAIWRCDYCDCSNQGSRQTCWHCETPRA